MGFGYYSDKHPQCRDAYEKDAQIRLEKEQADYNEYIIGRNEAHEKMLVDTLASSIEKFSYSICKLADAIAVQQPPIVVNITGMDDANVEKMRAIFHV